jgi:predicted amino acid-binding ACT domain protein
MSHDPQYFPRRIGVVTPRGEAIYEIVVVGEDKVGCLQTVLKILADRFVDLRDVSAYDSPGTASFVLNVFADLSRAEGTPENLRRELAKLPFVKTVAMGNVIGSPYSKFLFPVFITGEPRVLLFPAATLVATENRIIEMLGQEGRATMFEAGKSAGAHLSQELTRFLPWSKGSELMSAASDQLRAFGWGIFKFGLGEMSRGKVSVNVQQPPFVDTPGAKDSLLLVGIASGVLEEILGFGSELDGKGVYSAEKEEFAFRLKKSMASEPTPSPKTQRAKPSRKQ